MQQQAKSDGGDVNTAAVAAPAGPPTGYQTYQWVPPHQQQWMPMMQYPAAAMAMMQQQQMMMYPHHYLPYGGGGHPYYQNGGGRQQPPVMNNGSSNNDETKIVWIGDLFHWMDETYLHNCFSHTGQVLNVKVIRNKHTGQSEGYGFIEFFSRAAAEKVLQSYSGSLMPNTEQPFRLNWATFSAGDRRTEAGSDLSIFVGDLAPDVTDSMLQEIFSNKYPSVKGAKVIIDPNTGRSKGYGFVRFGDENERSSAMNEMNGVYCSSRPMRIDVATPKKASGYQQQYSSQGMSKRPKFLEKLAGTVKKAGHSDAEASRARVDPAENISPGQIQTSARGLPSPSGGQSSGSAHLASPPKPPRKRRRQFGTEEAELAQEGEVEGAALVKKKDIRRGKKSSDSSSKKRKGPVVLGMDDLGEGVREATSHLLPAFNELAEVVPPEEVSRYEDVSPEGVVAEMSSQMAKANYLMAKNKGLLLTLLSEGGLAQRLQNRLSEVEAKLADREEEIKNHEAAAVENFKTNKALKAAAVVERRLADSIREDLKAAQSEIGVLRGKVAKVEAKLKSKDEEVARARDSLERKKTELEEREIGLEEREIELEKREADLEAEKEAIRLEGVGDCAEMIPMVLPSLNMDPIYAAISYCKGDISEDEFRKWIPPPPEEVMDPAPISVVPAPEVPPEEGSEVPAADEDCLEIPPPDAEVAAPPPDAEVAAPPPDAEPPLPPFEPAEEENLAPARDE